MLTFDEQGHKYFWNGALVDGVTDVIEALFPLPEYMKSEESALFGKATHKAVELDELHRLGRIDNALLPWLQGWHKFRRDTGQLPVLEIDGMKAIETPMFCRALGYAGTPDVPLVDKARRKIVVVDIKTGSPSRRWDLQTAAYTRLIMDRVGTGWTYERVCVVLAPGDWRPYRPANPYADDFNVFVSMLNSLRWARAAGIIKERENG